MVDIYKSAGGKPLKVLMIILFMLTNFGTIIFQSNTFNDFLSVMFKLFGVDSIYFKDNSLIIMLTVVIILIPLMIKRSISGLDWLTYCSLFTAFYIIFVNLYCIFIIP